MKNIDKYRVKTTMDNSFDFFETMEEVNKFIATEIKFWSTEHELKMNTGYDESDFIIAERKEKFAIIDKTSKSENEYFINWKDELCCEDNARIFETENEAEEYIKKQKWENWASSTFIVVYE